MKWYFDFLQDSQPTWPKPGVDCQSCRVTAGAKREGHYDPKTKCCEFSPFVSAFALGAWLAEGGSWNNLKSPDLQTTVFGILHSSTHRKQEDSLCKFYQPSTGLCRIWAQRPATCFYFFCAGPYLSPRTNQQELKVLSDEAHFLKRWFFEDRRGSLELWRHWGEVMEDKSDIELSENLVIESWSEAAEHYLKAWQWLQGHQDLKRHHQVPSFYITGQESLKTP